MSRKLVRNVDILLSKEKGTIYKDPGGKINICLVYPNTYHLGMSNLGFQGIYGLLNRKNTVVCERGFLPDEEDIDEHRRTETPLFSFESKRILSNFDIVAFSVSFENDYPNILRILDLARIPSRSSTRNHRQPLLIAGGVCCFFNPEPIAEIFDIIFVGEAEESLDEFLNFYRDQMMQGGKGTGRRLNDHKKEIKNGALKIEGLYVPEYYRIDYHSDGTLSGRMPLNNAPEKIKKRHVADLTLTPFATSIMTPETEFSEMYLIEVMRGCPWSCRFCVVGHIYSPTRKKELATIEGEITHAKEVARKIGLISPSLSDYPDVKRVIGIDGVDFSITSLRADMKGRELVQLLKGRRSVSIAPEAGTERLRRIINKKITEEDVLSTAALILESGIENLRLYFMIGLPTETADDVAGIVELVKKIRTLSQRGTIVMTVSTFVPKPFTPFQWHPMDKLDSVKEKLKFIKKSLKDERGIRVFHDVPKYAHMQGLFARGDRRILNVLNEMIRTDHWVKACAAAGLNEDFYLFRGRDITEALPWDFIDIGISKERLWVEYEKALS